MAHRPVIHRHMLRWTALAAAVLIGLVALPGDAVAWWRGGWGWGWRPGIVIGIAPPVVVGPPVYYGPPAYYGPPPGYYAPPAGPSCYAGAYVCPLSQPGPVGAPCSCPTNGGRIGGRIG